MKKEAKIETAILKIDDIKPHPKNPKKHWMEGLRKSFKEMGCVEPIVVDENNVILAGHGRLKIFKELGHKKVWVIVKRGLTEKQKEKYLLYSNRIGEKGGWDSEALKFFGEELLLEAGFDQRDVDLLIKQELELPEGIEDEKIEKDEVPEVKVVINTTLAKMNKEMRDFLEKKFLKDEINIEVS